MINRELIRLKAVQITYAYYNNSGKDIDVAEKELFFSLSKAYEMYQQLLLLMVAINKIAARSVEAKQTRAQRLGLAEEISTKFIDNRFIKQLSENIQLLEFCENHKLSWNDEEEFVRRLYNKIEESDFYKEYMLSDGHSYEEDRELWRKIYRNILCENDAIDEIFESMSLYWNDDKMIVDTFVLKTIRKFDQNNGAEQDILPEYGDEDTKAFASRLFRAALENGEQYRTMIAEQTKNWKLDRMAAMDVIIMQLALAEIVNFPQIPVNVSINEYVEIAKIYSTPRSGSYINGVLDGIVKELKEQKLIIKE